jgi:endoglucanase
MKRRKLIAAVLSILLFLATMTGCTALKSGSEATSVQTTVFDTSQPSNSQEDSASGSDATQMSTENHPVWETSWQATDNIIAGLNLGNTLDCFGDWIAEWGDGSTASYETAWGNPVTTKEMITAVKNAGFNAMRIPVTWNQHTDQEGSVDKAWMDRVQKVVDYVVSQDLYCIINVHHDGGSEGWIKASQESYDTYSARFTGLWTSIATRFADYGEKLIFENVNEMLDTNNSWGAPSSADAYDVLNAWNQLFVDTVRATGGNNTVRNLVVMTYSGSCSESVLKNFVLPKDTVKDHLIIEVHNYDPNSFTFDDASWTTPTDKWDNKNDMNALIKCFDRLNRFATSCGAPVIIGEYGAADKSNDSERAKYASFFVGNAAEYGIKCFWWDTGGLLNRANAYMQHREVVDAIISTASSYGHRP